MIGPILIQLICLLAIVIFSVSTPDQWEQEYSKVGELLHVYARNTKFKALKGVMVANGTRDVVWLTEKCTYKANGVDDCDFFLQNVQTLMSVQQNPICRLAGGLSFSLDPWETHNIWGESYRKVYYPAACASILQSSIAGATMFDADWDLKQLANNTNKVNDIIGNISSVESLLRLGNIVRDTDQGSRGAGGGRSTTVLDMVRLWVAVVGIEGAVTPDGSILYFGNVSMEVRVSTIVKNVSAPSGFSDSLTVTPPLHYRQFVHRLNSQMPRLMRRLKSFRQLAQLALAQEAVKFIHKKGGVFPDGYLEALDYPIDVPRSVPALTSTVESFLSFEFTSPLHKSNVNEFGEAWNETLWRERVSDEEGEGKGGTRDEVESPAEILLTAPAVRPQSPNEEEQASLQLLDADYSPYTFSCTISNGSIADITDPANQLSAKEAPLLSFHCNQHLDPEPEEEKEEKVEEEPVKPPQDEEGIFRERHGLMDPCLPGTLAVWDHSAATYIMVPSAYLFVPGIPRMFNVSEEVTIVNWSCRWPEEDLQPGKQHEGSESTQESNREDFNEADLLRRQFFHTHFGPTVSGGEEERGQHRRLQLEFNYTLSEDEFSRQLLDEDELDEQEEDTIEIDLDGGGGQYAGYGGSSSSGGGGRIKPSVKDKIVIVQMPRDWETFPSACDLPHLLYELQNEWVHLKEREVARLFKQKVDRTRRRREKQRTLKRSYSFSSLDPAAQQGRLAEQSNSIAGLVLISAFDFIQTVIEVDSGYLGPQTTLHVPVRVVSHNFGEELLDMVERQQTEERKAFSDNGSQESETEEDDENEEESEDGEFVEKKAKPSKAQRSGAKVRMVSPTTASLACGISRTADVKKEPDEKPPTDLTANKTEDVSETAPAVFGVEFGGSVYRTLDHVSVYGRAVGCQSDFLDIPEGYELVPPLPDILNYVVAGYSWSTDKLILSDMQAYCTGLCGEGDVRGASTRNNGSSGSSGGTTSTASGLVNPNIRPGTSVRTIDLEYQQPEPSSNYTDPSAPPLLSPPEPTGIRPAACTSRILIRSKATTVPYGGFFYSTLDYAEVSGTSAGCQTVPLVLPEGFEVAPAISDIFNNLVAQYTWSTDALLLRDKRAYYTARAGSSIAGKMCCNRDELLHVEDQWVSVENADETARDDEDKTNRSSAGKPKKEQVLSTLRCNTRVLVREPIVKIVYDPHASNTSTQLHYSELSRTTQMVTMNVTKLHPANAVRARVLFSGMPSAASQAGRDNMYQFQMNISYSRTVHGGVDLKNIQTITMKEVPPEVVDQLMELHSQQQRQSGGERQSQKDIKKVSTDPASNPTSAEKPVESEESTSTKAGAAASSSWSSQELTEKSFVRDFHDKRNHWGKGFGSAMDLMDNHLLGNAVGDSSSGDGKGLADFIYRPATFSAISSEDLDLDDVLESEPKSESDKLPPLPSLEEQQIMLGALMNERIHSVTLSRRRVFRKSSNEAASVDHNPPSTPQLESQSAVLVKTETSGAMVLVFLDYSGAVVAHQILSIAHSSGAAGRGGKRVSCNFFGTNSHVFECPIGERNAGRPASQFHSSDFVLLWSEIFAAGADISGDTSDTATEAGQQANKYRGEWKLQAQWSLVPEKDEDGPERTVVELMKHMQRAADARGGKYDKITNNCHMSQQDGRKFLGINIDSTQQVLYT